MTTPTNDRREVLARTLAPYLWHSTAQQIEHIVGVLDAALAAQEGERGGVDGYLNNAGITPDALRYAATHEALCRSWIFDLLTGLADTLEAQP